MLRVEVVPLASAAPAAPIPFVPIAPATAQPAPPLQAGVGRGLDRAALDRALSVGVAECAALGAPAASLHVHGKVAPDGSISVQSDPPYAGTAAGKCFEAKLRQRRVPPYSGAPVGFGKTFPVP
jgi:hypothetical protein